MTREQYEKLKEYIEAVADLKVAELKNILHGVGYKWIYDYKQLKEKELDKLMFPEGNGE